MAVSSRDYLNLGATGFGLEGLSCLSVSKFAILSVSRHTVSYLAGTSSTISKFPGSPPSKMSGIISCDYVNLSGWLICGKSLSM